MEKLIRGPRAPKQDSDLTRTNVILEDHIRRKIRAMAATQDMSTQRFTEQQVTLMGNLGKSVSDLYNECEALRNQLAGMAGKEQGV